MSGCSEGIIKPNDELHIFQSAKEIAAAPISIGFHSFQTPTHNPEDYEILDVGGSPGVACKPIPYCNCRYYITC